MSKKIIICFDGTGNEVGNNPSNILKLYELLEKNDQQIAHYVPGIGTMEGDRLFGSRIWRKWRALSGLAFGRGLEDDVLDAYRFLCRNYRSKSENRKAIARETHPKLRQRKLEEVVDHDRIYIFGFSRGAYAARILAGFIHNFGLVEPEKLYLVTEVFRVYRSMTEDGSKESFQKSIVKLRQYDDVLSPNKSVPIRALGLFDTVASMVRFTDPISTLFRTGSIMQLSTHANVRSNASVRIVLEALSVDERRSMFRTMFWRPGPYFGNRFKVKAKKRTQFLRQRWFPGFHSDIGGTPLENRAGIGKVTLSWMLDALQKAEAQADAEDRDFNPSEREFRQPSTGIRLHPHKKKRLLLGALKNRKTHDGRRYSTPHHMAPIHPSMTLLWGILEVLVPKTAKRREWKQSWYPKPWYLPLSEPRPIPEDHEIDESVVNRMRDWPFYRPVNVEKRAPKWRSRY